MSLKSDILAEFEKNRGRLCLPDEIPANRKPRPRQQRCGRGLNYFSSDRTHQWGVPAGCSGVGTYLALISAMAASRSGGLQ